MKMSIEGPSPSNLPRGVRWVKNPLNGWEAIFSDCGTYRYLLEIPIGEVGPKGVFVMLNPSTATELGPDPTVRRCMGFAEREGWGALVVLNAYGLRSTDPKGLWAVEDPVGPLTDDFLTEELWTAVEVVCAWGVNAKPGRVRELRDLMAKVGVDPVALGTTKAGAPRHPLYVRADAALQPFRWGDQ